MVKIDTKLILQLAVVIVAVLFLTQSLYYGQSSGGNGGPSMNGQNLSGPVHFNGTIRTYDPILLITSEMDQATMDEIRLMDGVRGIRLEGENYLIDTETRDDVFPLAQILHGKGIDTVSAANVIAPTELQLQFGTSMLNITALNSVIRVVMEPLLDAGSILEISMVGVSNNGYLVDYSSPQVLFTKADINVTAKVASLDYSIYTYSIPWEDRYLDLNTSGFENATYEIKDTLVFDPPLDTTQIMTKKQFSYIDYIDASGALVSQGFSNRSRIEENFADVSVSFPSSALEIVSANETPSLDYPVFTARHYTLDIIDSGGYDLGQDSLEMETDKELNGTVTIEVNAIVVGEQVVSLSGFSLPS